MSWQDLDVKIHQKQYSEEFLSQTILQLIREKLKNETNVKYSMYEKLCNEAERRKQYIYDTFISNETETQICLSNDVLTNTLRRMSQISVMIILEAILNMKLIYRRMDPMYLLKPVWIQLKLFNAIFYLVSANQTFAKYRLFNFKLIQLQN